MTNNLNFQEIDTTSSIRFETRRDHLTDERKGLYAYWRNDTNMDARICDEIISVEPVYTSNIGNNVVKILISFIGWHGEESKVLLKMENFFNSIQETSGDSYSIFYSLSRHGLIIEPHLHDLFILYITRELKKFTRGDNVPLTESKDED